MTEWRLIKLDFGQSPAHFGEIGIGIEETSERVRSDTLFSAWMTAYARLLGGEAVEKLLEQFLSEPEPPFQISSTFIYRTQKGKNVFYLPRPKQFPNKYPIGNDLDFTKDYKKLNYLPLDIWKKWYQVGKGFDKQDLNSNTVNAYKEAYTISKVPKVAIDRTTRATNFYYTGFVQFRSEKHDKSGLYFLLAMPRPNSSLEDELQATLSFLGEEGIGGEKSSGAGRFQISWVTLPAEWKEAIAAAGNQHSLISTFWEPEPEDALLANASYELQERGGWITSPFSGRQQRRKSIQMFTEGSVFSEVPQGQLVDVTPSGFNIHKIYRSGIALSLPISTSSN